MSASMSQLLVRDHKIVRVALVICLSLFLVAPAALIPVIFIDPDGSLHEPIAAAVVLGGLSAALFVLCAALYGMTGRHYWRLDSQGIETANLFRHCQISWEEVSRMRIESYGERPCYKLTLFLQDGTVRMCDMAAITNSEQDDRNLDHAAILAVAPDKIELTEGPGFRTYVTNLAYWLLFAIVLFLVVDMVYKHFIAP